MFPEGDRDCPSATGEVVGTPSHDEPRASVVPAGQEERSPTRPRGDFSLVLGGEGHSGFAGRRGAVGRVGVGAGMRLRLIPAYGTDR